MSGDTPNDGAGSLAYQIGRGTKRELFIGHTPAQIVRQLQNPDYRHEGFPRDPEDVDPSTAPLGPVGLTSPEQRMYETWGFAAEMATLDPAARQGGPPLNPNDRVYVRAPFVPNVWRVYFLSGGTNQVLFAQPGPNVSLPSEFCFAANANQKSDMLNVPGRGLELSLWAAPGNGVAITRVVIVAMASVGGDFDRTK